MKIYETPIADLLLIEPSVHIDQRGFFLETYHRQRYTDLGFPNPDFVQHNHSRSKRGTLRGLHFQSRHPQGKLVRVTSGAVFDVALDIRLGSPTFGHWYGCRLDDENHHQLWIPPGFAHGFYVLSETVDFEYQCTDYYHPEDEHGVLWNDPDIGIEWPLRNGEPLLSDKDRTYPPLVDLPCEILPHYPSTEQGS